MNRMRTAVIAAAMTGSLLTGGVVGATLFQMTAANAASPTPAASSNPGPAGSGGVFKPNEDPTHEQGESAAREAQEDAGQRPTVP